MAFLSSPSSNNKVDTASIQVSAASTSVSTVSSPDNTANLSDATLYAFLANQPNGSQLVREDLEQIYEDDLEEMDLKWQLALLSMRARRYFHRTGKKITINGSDTAGYDKAKVKCFNCHKMGYFSRECGSSRNQESMPRNQDSSRKTMIMEDTSSKAMLAINGAGFDWSYMADDEVPTNIAFMAFSDSEVHNSKTCSNTCLKSFETLKTQYDNLRIEFNKSEFDLATYKRGLAYVEEQLVFYTKNEVVFCNQIAVFKRDASFRDSKITALNLQIEKLKKEKESNQIKINNFKNASMSLDKLIGSQITDNSKIGLGFTSYNAVAPPPTCLFVPPTIDLSNSGLKEFKQLEFEGYGPKASKCVSVDTSNEIKKALDAPIIKDWVSDSDEDESKEMILNSKNVQHKPEQANQHRNVIQNGNSLKRTGKDRDGRVIILPPTTTDEHIAVQRESNARTTFLQSIPDDHMRKSLLKQEFSEFRIGEAEGLHKGYDMMQKIRSQLNQLKAKPEDKDINLKFLRVLPSSWSQVALTLKTKGGLKLLSFDDLYYKLKTLEVDVKGYTTFSSSQSAGLSHSAFVSTTSASKKMPYGDSLSYSSTTTYTAPSNSKTGSHRSGNVIEDVLQSFVADTKPEQQLAYEDFKQIEKLDLEEMDLKWQMAMLSVRVHKFEQKAGRKIDFNKKESARFNKKKVRCYKCQQKGHFARECRANRGNDKQRYSSFKIKEIGKKEEDSKSLITIDTLVDWTDHNGESDGVVASKKSGMIAGCDTKDAIEEGAAKLYNLIPGADTEEASTAGWDDSAFSVFTTNSEDVEGRPLFNRFAKTGSMKVVPPPLSGDYTSLSDHIDLDESHMFYGTKSSTSSDYKSVSNNFISCDDSDESSEVNTNDFASSDSSVKSSEPKPNDSTSCASTSSVSTSENEAETESNVGTPIQKPIIVQNLPSFSCNSSDKNENTSRTSCNKNDCDFYEKQMVNKTVGIGVGTVHSKNKVNPQNQFVPHAVLLRTGKVNIPPASPHPVPTGKPKIYDKQNRVLFTETECLVLSKDFKLLDESMVVLRVPRKHNLYTINLNNLCPRGKQHKASYKAINALSSIFEPLQLLHMDLFGPTSIRSIDHKYYCHVITDDYSRFCWVFFLEHKDETYHILKDFINLVENQLNKKNPQQNGVADWKNKTLIEAARTMLADSKLPTMFWTEAVRTACYVLNRVLVTSPHNKTPYALLTENIPSVSHFKPFGCHVTILNPSDHLGKFDGKADEGYIVGYSASYKHVQANQYAGTHDATTNPAGTQDADSDLDCDEQVIIVPFYPSHSIQGTEPKDNSADEVDDSPFNFADEIFQKELARLKVPPGSIPVPPGSIPVPTGCILVPAGNTMVTTDDVPVHTNSPTYSFFDDEPTTRFPSPSDLGNHDPSPGIFSSSSYDDEFGAALNNVASIVEVSPVATVGNYMMMIQKKQKNEIRRTKDEDF
nr:hypothetical protein [Tanacetum cinerariifolium]